MEKETTELPAHAEEMRGPRIKTRIAVLGTLAELHKEPIRYNLNTLARLVEELGPDLLCAELRRDQWERGDWSRMPVEYREALIPLAERTNIVIVPIQNGAGCELVAPREGPLLGLRRTILRGLDGVLRALQWLVDGPRGVNSGVFGHVCDMICALEAWTCGAATWRAWDAANRELWENILRAVRRDPGVRVLVTVDCRRRHRLVEWLRRSDEVELVDFWKL